jgi:hypothetical protein
VSDVPDYRLIDHVTRYLYRECDFDLPCVPIAPGDRRRFLPGSQSTTWTVGDALHKGYDALYVFNRSVRDDVGRVHWTRAVIVEWGPWDEAREEAERERRESAALDGEELDFLEECPADDGEWQDPVLLADSFSIRPGH